jgi:putative glutamine amidotransferase
MAHITYIRCSRDEDYLQSLDAVGLSVRPGEPKGDIAAALHGADGIVLAGGPDVDPALYGETLHPTCSLAGDIRDAFEIAVARRCLREGLPLLAICRGMQVLNVAAEGSLIQDLPSQVPIALPHAVDESFTTVAHGIEVIDGTHLARAVAAGLPTQVNSRHHQAVKVIGQGLAVSAYATDGIVEAIEAPELPFCVGVQWHPENFWRTGEFLPLFRLFAAACRERAGAIA